MGHDVHFLERLDRVSDAQVELALTLYRDEALLREVLGRAGLPEGAERLAISLDDPVEGPFVVVTRAGRFVTCLGRGMRIDREPLPVLPRERLDAAAARVQRMREGLAEVQRLRAEGGDGVAARAFRRMQHDGLAFPREEMETLLEIQPLIARDCAVALARVQNSVRELRERAAYLRYQKLKPPEREFAVAFARLAWSMVHFMVLTEHESAHGLLETAANRPEIASGRDLRSVQMQVAFDLGTMPHAYRSLWGLARRPKAALRFLKELEPDVRFHFRAFREFGLGAVAVASQKVRAEALKALGRRVEGANLEEAAFEEVLDHASGTLGALVRELVNEPEAAAAHHRAWGKGFAAMLRSDADEVSDAEIAAVPDEVGCAIAGCLPLSWVSARAPLHVQLAFAVPWLARARPEELYLPAEWAEVVKPIVEDELCAFMIPYAKSSFLDRPAPVARSAPKVGRNAPCPCGSGKKHKHCCGRTPARTA